MATGSLYTSSFLPRGQILSSLCYISTTVEMMRAAGLGLRGAARRHVAAAAAAVFKRAYLLDVDGLPSARGANELAAIVALEYGRCPVHREDVQEGIGYCSGCLLLQRAVLVELDPVVLVAEQVAEVAVRGRSEVDEVHL